MAPSNPLSESPEAKKRKLKDDEAKNTQYILLRKEMRPERKDKVKSCEFLFLVENKQKQFEIVEAFSFQENATYNFAKLQKGYTYSFSCDSIIKQDLERWTPRFSELPYTVILNGIPRKLEWGTSRLNNFDPSQEFYEGERQSIKQLKRFIITEHQFKYRLVTGVKLESAKILRYLGCRLCTKSNPEEVDEITLRCSNTHCKLEDTQDNFYNGCMIIYDMRVKDGSGNELWNIVCYNNAAEKLLACKSDDFFSDKEAYLRLQQSIGAELNLRLSIDKNQKLVADHVQVLSQTFRHAPIKPASPSDLTAKDQDKVKSFLDNSNEMDKFFSDRVYKLDSKPYCGYVLIINLYVYKEDGEGKEFHVREGSNVDVNNLQSLFQYLGFKVKVTDQDKKLKHDDIKWEIKEFKKELKEGNFSSCFVIVMGHGFNDNLLLSDYMDSSNIWTDIVRPFSKRRFKEFIHKPKIFMFNKCEIFEEEVIKKWPRTVYNSMFCFSAFRGYSSIRRTITGSDFIGHFFDIVLKHHKTKHFKQLMSEVDLKMTWEREEELKLEAKLSSSEEVITKASMEIDSVVEKESLETTDSEEKTDSEEEIIESQEESDPKPETSCNFREQYFGNFYFHEINPDEKAICNSEWD